MKTATFFASVCLFFSVFNTSAQNHSVAREWNEMILDAIRNDYARPTVHARNLFHHSIITYDAWAAFDPSKDTYFLGDTLYSYVCDFEGIETPLNLEEARDIAISYASFRFIVNRYSNSPNYPGTYNLIENYMDNHGYDINNTSTDYVNGGPAELGNYLAEQIQLYGYTDGANEQNDYGNQYYDQINPPIVMSQPGNPDIQDPNRWQPITLATSIDQAGNPVLSTPPCLSPEWGEVHPFSLDTSMYTELTRDGDTYKVYFDTLVPAFLNVNDSSAWDSFYKWNHTLVSVWQSHLDPADGVNWDISPASIGNNTWYPTDSSEYAAFYNLLDGGDPSTGYAVNPVTGQPYTPQIVPRGDYARVLAEFWADGIDSETPPGHWYEIYHYVTDQPTFMRKWEGVGPELDPLEFDVKAHLALGGTLHDAAICAWSLKGYYDYIRPVSAIRYMADQGQSSDTSAANYHPNGIPLLSGYVELVQSGDPLAGNWDQHVGKIKLFTWKGHEYISDPLTDVAGVGWILAENWWPYQRPTFVTPPFSGFVSGHSTFSRAASKTMEFITGSPYFPAGLGEFQAVHNQYLKFEEGPSTTITLQWASYKDAADQCSLSRLWGGIHPPIDDIPGRRIGEVVGDIAFNLVDSIFSIQNPALIASSSSDSLINISDIGNQFTMDFEFNVAMDSSITPLLNLMPAPINSAISVNQISWVDSFNVQVLFDVLTSSLELDETRVEISNLVTGTAQSLTDYTFTDYFIIDTRTPMVENISSNFAVINDDVTTQNLILDIEFDEACDTTSIPTFTFGGANYLNPTLTLNPALSTWSSDSVYAAHFSSVDFNEDVNSIEINVASATDRNENMMQASVENSPFIIDTENPDFISVVSNETILSQEDMANPIINVTLEFDQSMDTTMTPVITFEHQGNTFDYLIQNSSQTIWTDTNLLSAVFTILPSTNDLMHLDINIDARDEYSNLLISSVYTDVLISDMASPQVTSITPSHTVISDSVIGADQYSIDLVFSEPMDTTVTPFVNPISSQNLASTIQYNVPLSKYIDSTTFRAFYQVIDQDIEIADVHLEVNYAKDFVGNVQASAVDSNFTTIDTKNPTAIGIYSNNYIINQGGTQLQIIALFDEDMLSTQDASIDFTPTLPNPSPLMLINSIWQDQNTFEFNYNVVGPANQYQVYDITIESAVDVAGNLMIPSNNPSFLTIEEFLDLVELEQDEQILYPSLLSAGNPVHIVGLDPNLPQEIEYDLYNQMGQRVQQVRFTKSNGVFSSDPISTEPGLYILRRNSQSFNLMITR